ncbi:MAG: DUF429 domain-containing protein [Thiobacillus sp.]
MEGGGGVSISVGVDGCRAGWIAVAHEGTGLTYRVHSSFSELFTEWSGADRILVDIPIGLPWRDCPSRPCDQQARALLGPRASSVFSPPSRRASKAGDIVQARAWNLDEVGRSLSAQAWGICKKIVEVDQVMFGNPGARRKVIEIHPEVCFWGLNGGKPMRYRKSKADGIKERLALLSAWEPEATILLNRALRKTRRQDVQADDVLDAMVAHVTGRAVPCELRRLVGVRSEDDQGLPMQMLFRSPQSTSMPRPRGSSDC